MTQPTEILVTVEKLRDMKIPDLTEDQAKKIIADTTSAVVKDKPAKIQDRTLTSITIKTPDALGDGPWLIVLITQEGEFVAVLSYDPKTNKFLIPHDEEIPNDGDIITAINNAAKTIDKAGQAIADAIAKLRDDGGQENEGQGTSRRQERR